MRSWHSSLSDSPVARPRPARGPNYRSAEGVPVAVFTGEFIDGKPLYRLPRMEVLGWRSSIEPDT